MTVRNVLIVDDESDTRAMCPDAILLNVIMPKLDGPSTLRKQLLELGDWGGTGQAIRSAQARTGHLRGAQLVRLGSFATIGD